MTIQYAYLREEYLLTHDSGDKFGSVMGWLFPLCAELLIRGDGPPDDWEYRPGALGAHHEDDDDYIVECFDEVDSDTLIRFGNVLRRYRNWLAIREEDY